MICKDKHENTVVEGLKCLRVIVTSFCDEQTMFSDHRVHMLDVHDWIELIQLLLYPAVKDTINSIMSNQYT